MGYVVGCLRVNPVKRSTRQSARPNWIGYPSINPSNVHVVAHGTNKWRVSNNKGGVLFDDEQGNIDTWNKHSNSGIGIQVTNSDTVLSTLYQIIDKEVKTLARVSYYA